MADLLTGELPRLTVTDALTSMDQLHELLMVRARGLMAWYAAARSGKRAWARGLRITSILCGSAATLVPMVVSVLHALSRDNARADALLPASSIFGLLAATSLLLDKFFGCSSSWMRYTVTHLELRARAEAFHLAWQGERLKLVMASGPPVAGAFIDPQAVLLEAVRAAHALHLQFLESINGLEKSETQEWVTEFRGTLADLERRIEEQRSAAVQAMPGRGAVRVTVEGAALLVGGRWELQLDDGEVTVQEGAAATLPRVSSGIHTLRLRAVRSAGGAVALDELVRVDSNQIADVRFKIV